MRLLRRPRVTLRRLGAGDAALWRALRQEVWARHPEAFGNSHDALAGQGLPAFADQLRRDCVLMAGAGKEPLGCAALDLERAAIEAVYVRAEHRGRGIGRRLLSGLLAEARGQGLARLTLTVAADNAPARALYARAGFRVTGGGGRRALTRDGRLRDLVEMAAVPAGRWGRRPQPFALQSAGEAG